MLLKEKTSSKICKLAKYLSCILYTKYKVLLPFLPIEFVIQLCKVGKQKSNLEWSVMSALNEIIVSSKLQRSFKTVRKISRVRQLT